MGILVSVVPTAGSTPSLHLTGIGKHLWKEGREEGRAGGVWGVEIGRAGLWKAGLGREGVRLPPPQASAPETVPVSLVLLTENPPPSHVGEYFPAQGAAVALLQAQYRETGVHSGAGREVVLFP